MKKTKSGVSAFLWWEGMSISDYCTRRSFYGYLSMPYGEKEGHTMAGILGEHYQDSYVDGFGLASDKDDQYKYNHFKDLEHYPFPTILPSDKSLFNLIENSS